MHGGDLLELGLVIMGLAVLARLAGRFGLSTIPLYLLAGLAFGRGGVLPLVQTEPFVRTGGELGLILLLFLLGLEYTARELTATVRAARGVGLADLALNFPPGFAAGLLLGWGPVPAAFLGGVTYVSSSGIAAKLLHDHGGAGRRGTPVVLAVLVIEDLVMALYLPVLAVLLAGGISAGALAAAAGAVAGVAGFLWVAARVEVGLSRLVFSSSNEVLLLSILGFVLVVAGIAELGPVSAAVGALLAGIAISGPAAHAARPLLAPLRDLFAALFFVFVGFGIDPATLPGSALPAIALGLVTVGTKLLTGWLGTRGVVAGRRERLAAGAALVARGEFSIAIAGLAAAGGLRPELTSLAVAYVLVMAVAGPVLARVLDSGGHRRPGALPAYTGLEAPTHPAERTAATRPPAAPDEDEEPMTLPYPVEFVQSLNARLEHEEPREILRWMLVDSDLERVAMASSFQAEGTCVIDMAVKLVPDIPVLFLETGFHFAETLAFKEQLTERLGLNTVDLVGEHTVESQAATFGDRLYERDPDLCCKINKVDPFSIALHDYDCWATALRRDSSPSRAAVPIVEQYCLEPDRWIVKVNPVANWSRKQAWDYLRENDLPHNPLYDLGYAQVGCAPCTRSVFIGEDERAGRWDGSQKVECGIHVQPPAAT